MKNKKRGLTGVFNHILSYCLDISGQMFVSLFLRKKKTQISCGFFDFNNVDSVLSQNE